MLFLLSLHFESNKESAMKHIMLFLISMVTWTCSFAQQAILLPSGIISEGIIKEMPYRDVVQQNDGFIVTYTFGSVIKQKNPEDENTEYLKIQGFGFNHEESMPCVPTRWDSFLIPDSTSYSIEIVDSSFIETNIKLPPARELDIITEKYVPQKRTVPISAYKGYYPQALVDLHQVYQYGDAFVLNVRICPIQYDYQRSIARIFSRISYKIKYGGDNTGCKMMKSHYKCRVKDSYLYNTTLNYPLLCNLNEAKGLLVTEQEAYLDRNDYLIISITEYSDAVNRFAKWKKQLGFNTHIALKDRGLWSETEVSNVIQNAQLLYPDLSFLVIIGDHQDVPAKVRNSHVTDYLYLNSANNISPVYNGRLSVSTPSEASIVVDKIINYERTPVLDSSFYAHALSCAFFQDGNNINDPRRNDSILCQYDMRRFVQTAEEVRNHLMLQGKNVSRVYYAYPGATPKYWNNGMYSFGEEIPLELQKPNFLWNGTCWNMNTHMETGTFCVVYNDHGGPMGWRDPWYHSVHLDYLHNNNKLPVVFSMCCETGCFNDTTCFAEKFIRKEDGGCVAIFAATGEGYSGYDDALTEGMIDAIWPTPSLIPQFPNHTQNVTPTPEPTYYLGQILKQGLKRMEETWGSGMMMRERYHCFGDPSMRILTNTPTMFSNATISRTENHISVQTGEGEARITFYDQRTDSIFSYIGSAADFTGLSDAVTVCISSHNKIPLVDERNLLYLQNETLSGVNEIEADVVIAGKNVTNQKPQGVVRFSSGSTVIRGNTVELHSGTSVLPGAELKIVNINP